MEGCGKDSDLLGWAMFLYLGREGGGGDGMLHTSFFFKPLGNKIYSIAYVVAKTLGGAGKGITPGIPPLYEPPLLVQAEIDLT